MCECSYVLNILPLLFYLFSFGNKDMHIQNKHTRVFLEQWCDEVVEMAVGYSSPLSEPRLILLRYSEIGFRGKRFLWQKFSFMVNL